MEKTILKKLINKGYTISEIATELKSGRSTISYWLKKFNITTNNEQKPREKKHKCRKCGETDPKLFYGDDKEVCGECHLKRVNDTGRENRKYAIEQLGGKCQIQSCGYNKYIGALDIHHLDPNIKDTNFKSMRGWSKARIDKEIKNCILLCKNCHAEIHGGVLKLGN